MPNAANATSEDPAIEAVYQDGLLAFRSEDYDRGLHALRFAADRGHFMARFYLARILSNNNSGFTDHHAAFDLFKGLAETDVDPDPQYDWRSVVMPSILLQYATYLRSGLPADQLHPSEIPADPDAARDQIIRAAQVYGDPDAQFMLAKLDLEDEASERTGLDQMATLAERRGHAPALAYLADMWLTGRHVGAQNPALAFAYMTLAVENAPGQDRIWIEQDYARMYCTIPLAERTAAATYAENLRKMNDERDIARVEAPDVGGLGESVVATAGGLSWRCASGEQVALPGALPSNPANGGDAAADGIVTVAEPAGEGGLGTMEASGGDKVRPASGPDPASTLLGNTMMGLGVKDSDTPLLSGQSESLGQ